MSPNDEDGMANSADPDQTAPRSSLIWVCTVCPGISVRKLRIITVYQVLMMSPRLLRLFVLMMTAVDFYCQKLTKETINYIKQLQKKKKKKKKYLVEIFG